MKAGIIGAFILSAFLFMLAFLTLDNGYVWMLFIGLGTAFGIGGIHLSIEDKKRQ